MRASSTTTTGFVLIDPPFRQSYRLLALFPYPAPILHQLVAALVTLTLAALIAILVRNVQPADILFYLGESMSTITAGLGLGALSLLPSASALTHKPTHAKPLRRVAAGPSSLNPDAATRLGGLRQVKQSASPAKGHHPGLRNTGNTCFFNSTVQSLASIPALRQHLADVVEAAERWDVPTPATDALLELIDALNTPDRRASAINPTALVNALRSLPSSPLRSLVSAHQQQDAHELFVLLSSVIEEEMLAVSREADETQAEREAGLRGLIGPSLPWSDKGFYSDPRLVQSRSCVDSLSTLQEEPQHFPSSFLPASSLRQRPKAAEATPQVSPFNTLLAQRTICLDCGYLEAIRHFSTEEISLSLPPRHQAMRTSQLTGTNACSVEECLAAWCELEPVEWICWRCSLVRTREKARIEVMRLEASASAETAPAGGGTAMTNGHANGHGPSNGQAAHAVETSKPSAAKKKRLRDAKSRETRLVKVLSSGLSEDELATLEHDPSSPFFHVLSGLKLDRQPSRMSTKQHMLSRLPRVLVLHLNRSMFSAASVWGGASKNDRTVLFPEYLDVSPFCVGGSFGTDGRRTMDAEAAAAAAGGREKGDEVVGDKRWFRLCSVTVHYGGHSFGHYVSFRRLPSSSSPSTSDDDPATTANEDQWVRISDETVRPCEGVEEVLSQNPFMLFYELVQSPPPHLQPLSTAAVASMLQRPQPHIEEREGELQTLRKEEDGSTVGFKPTNLRPRIVHRWSFRPASRETSVRL